MGKTSIQVVFLFASYKNFPSEERATLKRIVAEQYSRQFGNVPSSVQVQLYDGNAMNNLNDIVLAIGTNEPVMNEAVLRGKARDAIAREFSRLPFMIKLGFSGKIGLKNGLLDAGEKEDDMPSGDGSGRNDADSDGNKEDKTIADNKDYEKRAKQYTAVEPKYSFDMLKIPERVKDQIDRALGRIQLEREVFEEWGLYAIMPSPVCAMSFYGAAGTGKSMAAEAIASRLKKKIIRASYADIENKYVGEGPKNVSAIFLAAEQQDAVLFIDEADSLLSKRMVNVSEPSGQAMNSMRSQLLISLENFHGIVIFATNLAINYDRAFLSRLINIKFERPDAELREEIWKAHILPGPGAKIQLHIPLDEDVDLKALAQKYEFVGREIRNCVVDACVDARARKLSKLTQECLVRAAEVIEKTREEVENAKDETQKSKSLNAEQRHEIAETINRQNRNMRVEGKEIPEVSVSELEAD